MGAAAALADSEPYTIGQAAYGYGRGVITGVDYGHGLVSGYGAIGNRGYYGGYAGYGGIHHGFYGKREADSDSDAYTIGQVAHGHAYGVVTVATTEAMLAMEESTMATMASVRLILMPTPLARLPMASLSTMPTLLVILTMSESLPDTDTPDTEAMLDTEVTLDTSTDKCLPGHCPCNLFAQ